jgi:lysophospholipase L1-like esterase
MMEDQSGVMYSGRTPVASAYADRTLSKIKLSEESSLMARISPVIVAASLFLVNAFLPTSAMGQEKGVERWEKEIVRLERQMSEDTSLHQSVLFVGSSSIRLWNLDQFFPDFETTNHGFGGSQLGDTVQFFERIVVPVKPSVIVIYAGDNDIAAKKTPEDVHRDFQSLAALVEQKLPECRKVIYISIKPSVKRWSMATDMQKTNALIEAACAKNPRFQFLDIWPAMLTADGMPNADLLVADGLHMNANGYKIWADALRPHVAAAEPKLRATAAGSEE